MSATLACYLWPVTYGHLGFGLKEHCWESNWTKVEGHECKGKTIFVTHPYICAHCRQVIALMVAK